MEERARLYLAGTVAGVAAYLFVSLAFTGQFNLFHGGVFLAFFLVVMATFANVVAWADSLESD
jgi:hypothetical protein